MAQDNAQRESNYYQTNRKPKRIALDFDGVLHTYSRGWQDGTIYDEPVPGVVEAIKELGRRFELIIFTCREPVEDVFLWALKTFGMEIPVTMEKPHADMYIDDRGYFFDGDWNKAIEEINRRESEGWKGWSRTE